MCRDRPSGDSSRSRLRTLTTGPVPALRAGGAADASETDEAPDRVQQLFVCQPPRGARWGERAVSGCGTPGGVTARCVSPAAPGNAVADGPDPWGDRGQPAQHRTCPTPEAPVAQVDLPAHVSRARARRPDAAALRGDRVGRGRGRRGCRGRGDHLEHRGALRGGARRRGHGRGAGRGAGRGGTGRGRAGPPRASRRPSPPRSRPPPPSRRRRPPPARFRRPPGRTAGRTAPVVRRPRPRRRRASWPPV